MWLSRVATNLQVYPQVDRHARAFRGYIREINELRWEMLKVLTHSLLNSLTHQTTTHSLTTTHPAKVYMTWEVESFFLMSSLPILPFALIHSTCLVVHVMKNFVKEKKRKCRGCLVRCMVALFLAFHKVFSWGKVVYSFFLFNWSAKKVAGEARWWWQDGKQHDAMMMMMVFDPVIAIFHLNGSVESIFCTDHGHTSGEIFLQNSIHLIF